MLSYPRHRLPEGVRVSLSDTIQQHQWRPDGVEWAECIEALDFSDGADSDGDIASQSRYTHLDNETILDWVLQQNSYEPIQPPTADSVIRGGIRLLVLERAWFVPPSFEVTPGTFEAICNYFHLPKDTLLALGDNGGLSTHTLSIDEATGTLKRLTMILKSSQKYQVGNYGLAFSHDFTTGITSGILHGTGVTQEGRDHELWEECPAVEIFELIKVTRQLWSHPLYLPVVILQHHVLRTDYFCKCVLSDRSMEVQRKLGVMRAGRLQNMNAPFIATDVPVHKAKLNLTQLTIDVNSLMFEAIYFCRVSDWQCGALKKLQDLHTKIEELGKSQNGAEAVRMKLDFLAASAESIRNSNVALKEVGEVNMNVLYSIISQVDNRLNAKMAAAASRDSAAMKTLAFLTTLFLPGTFVASVFSTGMFEWQRDPSDVQKTGKVVSDLFWVYWAFAVPLTIIVGVGWRVWWSWEKKNFDADVNAQVQAVNGDPDASTESFQALSLGYMSDDMASVSLPATIRMEARQNPFRKRLSARIRRRRKTTEGVSKVEER